MAKPISEAPTTSGPRPGTRRAYEAIRDGITFGTHEPGEWLREASVADDLGVSRTPVREALRMLASEGMVELVHNRGARVVRWSAEDIDEVYRLRALLEGQGAAMAARRALPAQVDHLDELEARFEESLSQDAPVWAGCNDALHAAILACASSPRLTTLLDVVSSAPLVTRVMQRYGADDLARSVLQHRDVLTAIRHHDEDLAEAAMRGHILAARYVARRLADEE